MFVYDDAVTCGQLKFEVCVVPVPWRRTVFGGLLLTPEHGGPPAIVTPINGLPSTRITRLGVIFTLLVQGFLTLFTAGRGPTL